MLIQKGGIFRKIDARHLQQYRDKGYVKVEKQKEKPANGKKK